VPLIGFVVAGNLRSPLQVKKRVLSLFLLWTLMLSGSLFETACGGGGSTTANGGTPPGTYAVDVTGTSGSMQHSTVVTLTVK
jgi:hypothetical protein